MLTPGTIHTLTVNGQIVGYVAVTTEGQSIAMSMEGNWTNSTPEHDEKLIEDVKTANEFINIVKPG